MDTSEFLAPSRVAVGVEASSKKRAIEMLAEALAGGERPLDNSAVLGSLLARERLGSTAVGDGVALPHGRVGGLDGSRGAFLRLARPVDFDAADGRPVDLLFGLIVPVECGDEHLAALAAVAARFEDRSLRARLREAADPRQAAALLQAD